MRTRPPGDGPAAAPWRHLVGPALLAVAASVAVFVLHLLPAVARIATLEPEAPALGESARPMVLKLVVRLLLAHVAVGAALAGLAALLFGLVRRRVRSRTGAAGVYLLLWAALAGYAIARAVIVKPVFFEAALYAPGGVTRWIMNLLTDHLTPGALDAAAAAGIAILGGLYLLDLPSWPRRFAALGVAALVAVAMGVGPRLAMPRPPAPGAGRPNLLLIGVESLRSDAVSGFGAARKTTPSLDRLIARGVAFSNALVPLARTLPSWTSLLTGAYPHTHGHRHMFPGEHERPLHLDTLPRRLARLGYATAAVSDYAGEFFNLIDYGFHHVDAPPPTGLDMVVGRELLLADPFLLPFLDHAVGRAAFPVLKYLPANADPRALGERVGRWIRRLERPFFLAAFVSTPHVPYAAPYPYYRKFGDPDYEGPNKYAYQVRSLARLSAVEGRPPAREQRRIRDLYDGAVFGADAAIGTMLAALAAAGAADNTIVVVTGDHGERFFEGASTIGHGRTFRDGDAANRVPLIVAAGSAVRTTPPLPRRRVDAPVSTVDATPTLLDLLGLGPLATAEGESLRPFWTGDVPPVRPVFAETGVWLNAATLFRDDPEALVYPPVEHLLRLDRRDGNTLVLRARYRSRVIRAKHRMLRLGRFKLVYEPTRTGVRRRLFDAVADPENRHDLAAARPRLLRELTRRLQAWMCEAPGTVIDSRGHPVRRFTYFE